MALRFLNTQLPAWSFEPIYTLTLSYRVGEHLNSVYQKRPKGRSLVRCHYFAWVSSRHRHNQNRFSMILMEISMDDCTDRLGEMTHGDQEEIWKQPDLSKEPRYVNGNVVGSWYDAILSVQCFWVHATTESSQTSATSTDIAAPTPRADPTLDSLPESSTEDSEGPSPPDLVNHTRGSIKYNTDFIRFQYTSKRSSTDNITITMRTTQRITLVRISILPDKTVLHRFGRLPDPMAESIDAITMRNTIVGLSMVGWHGRVLGNNAICRTCPVLREIKFTGLGWIRFAASNASGSMQTHAGNQLSEKHLRWNKMYKTCWGAWLW